MEAKGVPMSVKEPRDTEPRPATTEVKSPVEVESGTPKRPWILNEISGMADESANLPVVELNPAPHFLVIYRTWNSHALFATWLPQS